MVGFVAWCEGLRRNLCVPTPLTRLALSVGAINGDSDSMQLYSPSIVGPSPCWDSEVMVDHSYHLLTTLLQVCGKEILAMDLVREDKYAAAKMLYQLPNTVVLSHGIQDGADGPILNYGNLAAQRLFNCSWDAFTTMPSTYTAEQPNREERRALLQRVSAIGFIDDYSGIRIAVGGRRFIIRNACVWNIVVDGTRLGQAACFHEYEYIP
jgi:hypothetical protein